MQWTGSWNLESSAIRTRQHNKWWNKQSCPLSNSALVNNSILLQLFPFTKMPSWFNSGLYVLTKKTEEEYCNVRNTYISDTVLLWSSHRTRTCRKGKSCSILAKWKWPSYRHYFSFISFLALRIFWIQMSYWILRIWRSQIPLPWKLLPVRSLERRKPARTGGSQDLGGCWPTVWIYNLELEFWYCFCSFRGHRYWWGMLVFWNEITPCRSSKCWKWSCAAHTTQA